MHSLHSLILLILSLYDYLFSLDLGREGLSPENDLCIPSVHMETSRFRLPLWLNHRMHFIHWSLTHRHLLTGSSLYSSQQPPHTIDVISRWTTVLMEVSCSPPRYCVGFLDFLWILQCRLKTPEYLIQHSVCVSSSMDSERNSLLYPCHSTQTIFPNSLWHREDKSSIWLNN